ncbi:MAG: hypothetical protein JW814_08060 [Candidatus Krumholzibacteriota bacterium]|nr:hypothetical protein [Candidatus Krumholzibacteriota bacterium]
MRFMSILSAFLILFTSTFVLASGQDASRRAIESDYSKLLVRVKSTITLTPDQDANISALYREYNSSRKSIIEKYPEENDNDRLSRQIEIRRLNRDIETRLIEILDPEQLETFNGIREEHIGSARREHREKMRTDEIDLIIERLELTGDQEEKVIEILEKRSEKINALMEGRKDRGRGGFADMRKRMEMIDSEIEESLRAILNDDQMIEYTKIHEERREKMRSTRPGPGGSGEMNKDDERRF